MPNPSDAAARASRRTWRAHLRDVRAFDAELAPILRDAAREGERIVTATIGDNVSATVRRAQTREAVRALRSMTTDMFGEVGRVMGEAMDRSSRLAAQGIEDLNLIMIRDLEMPLDLRHSFLSSSQRAVEHVRSRLINDIDLSRTVYRTEALSRRWIQREVNRGLALGRSADEIARSVRQFIRPDVRGGVSFAARRLGRTEINNAFHTTTIRGAAAMPWVEGMKWNLSESHPRPDPCDDFAKEDHDDLGPGIFKPGNVPPKPHPQCFCYVTAVMLDDEAFLDRLVEGRYDRFLNRRVSA